jgi:hypothetical protein
MAQTATRRLTRALASDDTSDGSDGSDQAVMSREEFKAAVKEGVTEGLKEHWRRTQDDREHRRSDTESSSRPLLRFVGSTAVLAVLVYAGRKRMGGSDGGTSDQRDVALETTSGGRTGGEGTDDSTPGRAGDAGHAE